jgi:quinol monooxygenase YgiN
MPTPSLRRSKDAATQSHYLFYLCRSILLLASLVIAGMFLWNSASVLSLRSSSNSHTLEQPSFSLMVTLQFTATEYKEQFLREIQPEADYVKANEPGTLAYNVLLSDQDPLQVLVLERYQDKEEAYLQIHKSSTPFLAFRPKLQAMQEAGHVTISGHSYLDSGVGFGDRT